MFNIKSIYFVVGLSIINLGGVAYLILRDLNFDNRVVQSVQNNDKAVLDIIQSTRLERDNTKISKSFMLHAKNIDFPMMGAVNGDVVIYEWMDYQCGYCKAIYSNIKSLIGSNKNITVKLVEFPILGDISQLASAVALSAQQQGKYAEFHNRLMLFKGRLSEDIIFEQARLAGLNIQKTKEYITSDAAKIIIKRNMKLGQLVGAAGTPFIIAYGKNDAKVIGGFVKLDTLTKIVKKLAENK